MTPEQIETLVNQAIKNVGQPYFPDASCKTVLFQEAELIEFVRLVRADDEALLHQALELLDVKWNGVAEVPHLFNVSRAIRKRLGCA